MKKLFLGLISFTIVLSFAFFLFNNLTVLAYEPMESNTVIIQDSYGNPIAVPEGVTINSVTLLGTNGLIMPNAWKYAYFNTWTDSSDPVLMKILTDNPGIDDVCYSKLVTSSYGSFYGNVATHTYSAYMTLENVVDSGKTVNVRIIWWEQNYLS